MPASATAGWRPAGAARIAGTRVLERSSLGTWGLVDASLVPNRLLAGDQWHLGGVVIRGDTSLASVHAPMVPGCMATTPFVFFQ
jgi:hypothetical protein